MKMLRFGDFLVEENRLIEVDDSIEYACGGVRLNGKGAFVREYKYGSEIKKKFVQHELRVGDIVYSTLFAKSGAFAVADADVDGVILSEKFPTFRLIDDRINRDYIKWFFRSGQINRIAEDQATGMAAFSLSHLSKKKFLNLKMPVPTRDRQIEVIDLCENVSNMTSRCDKPIRDNIRLVDHLIGTSAEKILSHAPMVSISSIGKYETRAATINPDDKYMQVTVAMNRRGLRLRRVCDGREIKSAGQCYVKEGDLLFSRIDIRQGAIGFVPRELDGAVVTRDFPVFRLNNVSETAKSFLNYVFMTPSFIDQAASESRGTTGRKKLKRDYFLDFTIPWPLHSEQEILIKDLNNIHKCSSALIKAYKSQMPLLVSCKQSIISSLFAKDAGLF